PKRAESNGMALPTSYVKVKGPGSHIHRALYFFEKVGVDKAVLEKNAILSQLALSAPGIDLHERYYADILDTPGYPAADLCILSGSALASGIRGGSNVVSLSGHGSASGLCALSPTTFMPSVVWPPQTAGVIYADSCLTAKYDDGDSFGEFMTHDAQPGTAAYIGNSRYSWIGRGHYFELDFWKKLAGTRILGQLFNTKILHANHPM